MLTPGDDQIEAMLLSAKRSRRDSALLTLMVDTGARKGEIAALKCDDVDIASGMIRFPVSKSMARTVPLSERSIAALGAGCASGAAVPDRCGGCRTRMPWCGASLPDTRTDS